MNLTTDVADVGLNNLHVILDLWRAGKSESLIDYTKSARVEPVLMVDSELLFAEETPEVAQSMLSQFSGYYLQAAALSCQVGKIQTMRHLDRLNPNRSPLDSGADAAVSATTWMMSQESYAQRLPRMNDAATRYKQPLHMLPLRGDHHMAITILERESGPYGSVSLEAADPKAADKKAAAQAKQEKKTEFGFSKDSIATVKELSNLSVGKLLSVNISDGVHKGEFPIAIRLMAVSLPSSALAHMLSLGNQDKSMSARWHGWRSGRLAFWRDIVGTEDLIEAHRDALMKDHDGLFRQLIARKRKNTLAGLLSGNPSIASASNMAIIAKETADQIELETVSTLDNFNTRQKVFEPTSLMILAVVARDYNRVTFYYRGMAEKTEVSLRDLKASNKGSGPDVSDILKAFVSGHAPSL